MSAISINKENFESEVLRSDKPVLLDFWAPWCGPCQMVVPIVEEIAAENPHIKVGKVNVQEQRELAKKFQLIGCDIDQNVITRTERGDRKVSDKEILAITIVFGITTADLFENNNLEGIFEW